MPCTRFQSALALVAMGAGVFLAYHRGFAQANGTKTSPWPVALPVSLEWSESIHPLNADRFMAEGFKFRGGTKNLKLQFSTQAPSILGGKQFSWMPGGYQLAEFTLTRKWGAVYGFRSLRHNSRIVRSDSSRVISGAGIEAPRSIFGSAVTVYIMRAVPTRETLRAQGQSLSGATGMQAGLTISRSFRKNARMQAEWTESWHERHPAEFNPSPTSFGGVHGALRLGFEGTLAKTEISSALLARQEALANPAAPAYSPGKRNVILNARRRFKGHQFQYGLQTNDQRASRLLGLASHNVREQSVGWSYSRKRLPQIAASQSLKRETVHGRREEERGFRLSLAKPFHMIDARLTLIRNVRVDLRASRPLWDSWMLNGDATIAFRKGRRLHLQYETTIRQAAVPTLKIVSATLRADTRLSLWSEKIALVPTAEFRHQDGSLPAFEVSAARLALAAEIKMPHRLSGTGFLVSLASNHLQTPGHSDWSRTDLIIHWNFKRF